MEKFFTTATLFFKALLLGLALVLGLSLLPIQAPAALPFIVAAVLLLASLCFVWVVFRFQAGLKKRLIRLKPVYAQDEGEHPHLHLDRSFAKSASFSIPTLTTKALTRSLLFGGLLVFVAQQSFAQCSISLTPTVSGCYQSGGQSKATISVEVAWSNAPSGENIIVTGPVGSVPATRTVTPGLISVNYGYGLTGNQTIVSPQVVAFEIPANGASGLNVQANFSVTVGCAAVSSSFSAPVACPALTCSGNQTGGTVYSDYNADGVHSSGETNGVAGVTVRAYNGSGAVVATTVTNPDGKYVLNLTVANYPVRVEFSGIPSLYGQGTPNGTNGRTTVQFVSAPTCSVDLGLLNPENFCQTDPSILVPCYVNGDPLVAGDAAGLDALVAFPYSSFGVPNQPGYSGAPTHIANASQVGTLWGNAYNRVTKRMFNSATLRRHAGLGPLGIGGIYVSDLSNPASPVVANFIDVEVDLGIDVDNPGSPVLSNSARGLTGSKTAPNNDASVIAQIGRVGIGDLDISEDGNTLWFVNMYDKTLYAVDISAYNADGLTKPTAANVTPYAIPAPACSSGEARPFALKVFNGEVYVGMVCDASISQNKSDLRAYVYKWNGAWSLVFEFPLTYPKGSADTQFPLLDRTGWYPWTDDWATYTAVLRNFGDRQGWVYPMPMLTDIEFDIDGSMIMAFGDRAGFVGGNRDYPPVGTSPLYSVTTGGDIVRAQYLNGTYILENAAKAGPYSGYGPTNNQGLGFGEFYDENLVASNDGVTFFLNHAECVIGALALRPGSGEVIVTAIDPLSMTFPSDYSYHPFDINGVIKSNNSSGVKNSGYAVYQGEINAGLFGKGVGLGDIELGCATLQYLQLGNYAWIDADQDGVQDPHELPLAGVNVSLYDNAGTLLATTTTGANGEYYFTGLGAPNENWTATSAYDSLQANTQYVVVFGTGGQWNNGAAELTAGGLPYTLTVANTGEGTLPDQNDSDLAIMSIPALGNYPAISVTTGILGYVNHTLDAGFYFCPEVLNPSSAQTICEGDAGADISVQTETNLANSIRFLRFTSDQTAVNGTETTAELAALYAHGLTNAAPITVATVTPTGANPDYTATLSAAAAGWASLAPGTYYVYAILNPDQGASCRPVQEIIVTVVDRPDVSANNVTVCQGTNINLNDYVQNPTSGSTTTLYVTLADAQNATNAIAGAQSPAVAGTYYVRSELTGNASCYATASFTVTVETPPAAMTICEGQQTYTLTASGGLTGVQWYRNNVLVGSGDMFTVTLAGSYTYTGTGANGCATGSCCPKEFIAAPIPLANPVTLMSCPTTPGGTSADFTLTDAENAAAPSNMGTDVDNGASGMTVTYHVSNADAVADINALISPYTANGTVVYARVESGDACYAIATITLMVKTSPSISLGTNPMVCQGITSAPLPYIATTQSPTQYSIDFDVTAEGQGFVDVNFTALNPGSISITVPAGAAPGTYNASVTVVNADGCTSPSVVFTVTVLPCMSLGSTVFYDNNNNAQQDLTELAIDGVVVNLYRDTDGNNVIDGTEDDAPYLTTTTDVNGNYYFGNLPSGKYVVAIPTVPVDAPLSSTGQDNDSSDDAIENGAPGPLGVQSTIITLTPYGETTNETSQGGTQDDANDANGDMTVDFGFFLPVSVGDTAFVDTDHDGLQEPTDPGLPGVTVTLYDAATGNPVSVNAYGDPVTPIVTDANGAYLFDSLPPGSYYVAFDVTTAVNGANYVTTTQDVNGNANDTDDSDANPTTGQTAPTGFIPSGQSNLTLDAGFFLPVSVGDTAFVDNDRDGLQEATDPGLAGVTVTLYDAATGNPVTVNAYGDPVTPIITDANGAYLFDSLPPGSYYVVFDVTTAVNGANYVTTTQDVNGNANDADDSDANPTTGQTAPTGFIPSGQSNLTLDAGFFLPVSVGDTAFVDNDHDGLQEPTDPGLPGVTVTLYDAATNLPVATNAYGDPVTPIVTDANGAYLFDSLPPGSYYVVFDVTTAVNGANYIPTTQDVNGNANDTDDSDANPTTGQTAATGPLTSGQSNLTLDAGFFLPVSVGDTAFVDNDHDGLQEPTDPGLPGVTVTLYDAATNLPVATNAYGDPVTPIVTDANGAYLFDSLPPGSYYVVFDVTTAVNGANYVTTTQDVNGNANDADDSDANPTTGQTAPTGFIPSGQSNLTLDAGFFLPVSVGDTAFVDNDHDGLQEATDPGLAGVTVTLYDAATGNPVTVNAYGDPVTPIVTDANGAYLFDSLAPGSYYVVFDVTTAVNGANYIPTTQDVNGNANDTDDSDANPTTGQTAPTGFIPSGQSNLTLDAGFFLPVSVGDTAFVDNDHDGLQEPTDPGLAGVTVTLYDAATGNPVTVNAYGDPVTPIVTDANGAYLFDSLPPGSYYVIFDVTTAVNGANYVTTTQDVNGNANDLDDSDANPTTGQTAPTGFIPSGQSNLTLDAGFFLPVSVGDTAFVDNDHDGLQEPTDPGLAGVTVTLYDAATGNPVTVNAYGDPVTPIITDANGAYLFDSLPPGSYYVVFDVTTAVNGANYVTTTQDVNGNANDTDDSDANPTTGQTAATGPLTSGQSNLTLDAGFFLPVSVGDTAFVDNDHDGLQEPTDPGLAGVTVTLYDAATGNPVTLNAYGDPVTPIVTDANGAYLFDSLPPGSYYVVFDVTTAVNGANYVTTTQDVNGNANDTDDSDANPTTGQTAATGPLTSGQSNLTLDAGFFLPVSVGDTAFVDNDHDGLQEPTDPGLPGVTVTLYDAATNLPVATNAYGDPVTPIVTDANGAYLFDSLPPGSYYVVFDVTTAVNGANYVTTTQDVNGNANDTDDSDANPATGQTAPTGLIPSGQSNLTLDAGFFLPVSVGDTAFVDNDHDGLQEPTDPGLAGVTVTLYDAATGNPVTVNAYGDPVTPIVTDANGAYLFDSLPPGSYYVVFDVTTAVNGDSYSPTLPDVGNNDALDSDADPSTGQTNPTPFLSSGQHDYTLDAGFVLCAPIACIELKVKLGATCEVLITPEMVLAGTANFASAAGFELIIADMNGQPVPGNLITGQYAGMRLRYLIKRKACPDSFCWGEIVVEDGSVPRVSQASFSPDPVYCFDANFVLNNPKTIGGLGVKPSPRQAPAGTIVGGPINDEVLNLGIAEFNSCDPTCKITVKWSDKLEVYGCDSINATGTWGRIYREWVATNCRGMRKDTVQVIVLKRPALSAFAFTGAGQKDANTPDYDWTVTYNSCTPDKALIQKVDWMPRINSSFHMLPDLDRRKYLDEVECNYSVQIKDTEFPICGGKGLKIDRELYVFDWCAGGIVDTFHILIKIGDFEAPTLEYAHHAPNALSTGPMDCTAAFPISVAGIKSTFGVEVKDNCGVANISVVVKTKDRYLKGILLAENTWDQVEYAVMNGNLVGLPVGRHRLIIDAYDGCYNSKRDSFEFEVLDKIAPVMVCDDQLNVTLSNANGYTSGYAQVSASEVDEGSTDNCKLSWIRVRRNVPDNCTASFIAKGYDSNGNGKLDPMPADGDWTKADGFDLNGDGDLADFGETFILKEGKLLSPLQEIVEFFCCDVEEKVTIELWGEDTNGNRNFCWKDIQLEDKVAPTCVAPWDLTIDCDDKNLASIDDRVASAAIWGDVTVSSGDDCAALSIEYHTEKHLKCGSGYIDRIWSMTKQTPKGPITISCKQRVTVRAFREYNICFPKDVSTDCKTPIIDTVLIDELGCDILAVNVTDKRYDAALDECYKIFRTYTVIDWCAYDDRCGDPMAEGHVYVLNRATFENYGKSPIYVLVRDEDRDGDEECYLSQNLTINESTDLHLLGDTAPKNAYKSGLNGTLPKCEATQEYYHSFMYTQVIKVYDSERPVVTGIRDTFCTSPEACTANITKVVKMVDNCTDQVELERQMLMIAPFQTTNAGSMILYSTPRWSVKDLTAGEFEISVSNLPEGTHDLIVVGRDECGNLSAATRIPFVVKDCKAPAPICINGLSTELMPDGTGGGMMAVWASDFVASPIYDCNGQDAGKGDPSGRPLITKYSINRVGEPVLSTQTGINLTCADKGKVILVELHAWDNAGNHDFCVTYVEVQDNRQLCVGSAASGEISGLITTDDLEPVLGVNIDLSGGATMTHSSTGNGTYSFAPLTLGSDYTLSPQLDKDHLNGVSTFDLVQIQKHILGVKSIDNPYRMIAADVNNSKSISTLDMIQIRKLILNIDTKFTSVPSWKFVDATYQFPDPSNPWSAAFPEVVNVNDLQGKVKADFIAIKMGDVNGNASTSGAVAAEVRGAKNMVISTEEQQLKQGQNYTVVFKAKDLNQIQGYQFTLNIDPNLATIEGIDYTGVMKPEHFGYFPKNGMITTSYHLVRAPLAGALPLAGAPSGIAQGEAILFTLKLKAESTTALSRVLELTSRLTNIEAYTQSEEVMGVKLAFGTEALAEQAALYQNVPNPFSDQTSIAFYLPKAAKAVLTVRDVKGALLYKVEGNFSKGNNQLILKQNHLRATGVLYYTLETNDFIGVRKMVLLNQ